MWRGAHRRTDRASIRDRGIAISSIGSALGGAGDPMVRAPTFGLSGCHLPATIGLWDASDRPAEVIHPLGWPENDDSQGGDGSSG
jgi:hypothetical protein